MSDPSGGMGKRLRVRREPRVAYRVPARGVAALCQGPRYRADCVVENLSASGALLRSGSIPPLGERLRITLRLPDDRVVEVEGIVVRRRWPDEALPEMSGGAVAVAFERVPPDSADAIHDTVVDVILGSSG